MTIAAKCCKLAACAGPKVRGTMSAMQKVPGRKPSKVTSGASAWKRMKGAPGTCGLSWNLGSCKVSGTTSTPSEKMACAQKAISRSMSVDSRPTQDLNHWRFWPISEIEETGVWKRHDARCVIRSKLASGGESRTA